MLNVFRVSQFLTNYDAFRINLKMIDQRISVLLTSDSADNLLFLLSFERLAATQYIDFLVIFICLIIYFFLNIFFPV